MQSATPDDRARADDIPSLVSVRPAGGALGPCLAWRFESPRPSLSSAIVGGGTGDASWILNLSVTSDYRRTDPTRHLREVATELELEGPGIAMMTAVSVDRRQVVSVDGVVVCATVGVGTPIWAADDESTVDADQVAAPGTINVVALVPADLEPGTLVNLATTVTEAKVQALADAGVPGTGTATDAVCVVGDRGGPHAQFGGPRSTWGRRVAIATHRAISLGLDPSPS